MTNAEAWFNKSLRPRKPEGSLGRTAQDGHLDSHTAPELCAAAVAKELNIHIWIDQNIQVYIYRYRYRYRYMAVAVCVAQC